MNRNNEGHSCCIGENGLEGAKTGEKTLPWKRVESFNVSASGGTQVLCAGRTPGWGGRCREPICVFEQDPYGQGLEGARLLHVNEPMS